jgi:hypothetical protein
VDTQLDEPGMLWPMGQGEQVSVAPVEKWFAGHSTAAVLSEFVL